ncbi:tRNA (adenosine(37)-N6)-threonylcarbamoyltransferase complex ATPase subunit type 1 TsaE [Alkalibacter rhizosphaerae]|uniref:tRNA threonylcarbamoyladenosine biosynthesis protein TsaE n=1 Tax=Alkalibacter rhizosphaerae TaxID=2815577 RepID=A0A974XDU2_9FIRM|nr:tRNA (adenosine(37)-N6)-threonylcarbamoyltransferase complex ATPase subunit type 1 TsaE [Alkalibacter rhizosphaerae]QSX08009.1 tRNA (adenosine(37)-N6)-threonylcarbamoyltransferase complex ATPase subunit type 1 TsaE [Alkalibacter rhizosphaerae]
MSRGRREIKTFQVEETQTLGRLIGEAAQPGWIVCLEGPMGGGKTALSQGILKGFGVTGYITSPTFSIVHTYETNRGKIHHFDVYRLSGMDELLDIGFEDYLKDGIVVMEWASIVRDELDGTILDVTLELGDDPQERTILLEGEESLLEGLHLDKGWEKTC